MTPANLDPRDAVGRGGDGGGARSDPQAPLLEDLLGDREYMVDDHYTLVEVCYTPLVEFFGCAGVVAPARVDRGIGRMLARPSALATKPMK